MSAVAKKDIEIVMKNGTSRTFKKDKKYECIYMGYEIYILKDDNNQGLKIENEKDFFDNFREV